MGCAAVKVIHLDQQSMMLPLVKTNQKLTPKQPKPQTLDRGTYVPHMSLFQGLVLGN